MASRTPSSTAAPSRTPRNRPKVTSKAKETTAKSGRKKTSRKPSKWSGRIEALRRTWADPNVRSVAGIFLICLATFVGTALISGLFTGAEDYRFVREGLSDSGQSVREPFKNILGGVGAHLAYWLARQGLGMGALVIPFWLGLIALPWLTNKPINKRGARFRLSFIFLIMLPWTVAFAAHLLGKFGVSSWDYWIGSTGHFMLEWSLIGLGAWGTGGVMASILLAWSVYQFQPQFGQWKIPKFRELRNWFRQDGDTADESNESLETSPLTADAPDESPEERGERGEDLHLIDDASEFALDELLDTIEDSEEEEEEEPEPEAPAAVALDPETTPMSEGKKEKDDVAFEVHVNSEEEQLSVTEIDRMVQEFGEYDPKLDLSRFELPNVDLLVHHSDGKQRVSGDELEANKRRILDTLRNFSIEVSSIKAEVGPTVTLYEIIPAPGIRISKIKNLEDDIALSLAALGIRIIAPIPGRGTIGIEVPNSNPDIVSMRDLIASDKFQQSKAALPVAIGKTISNETLVFDLTKMPHLLMAGATGQGKSVGLNAILVSLLYRKHPSQLKFVLVDPKKVELTLFNHIERHYLAKLPDSEEAIITDTSKVVATLNSLCAEMDQRYDLLKTAQCRNIAEYNTKFIRRKLNPEDGHHYLPYIVLVVDEFADLIMTAGKEVETPIARLAQLARAIGIHLIIATQRPSVNIITGTIKANFPARIAFRVTSKIDSRTILDAGGADQLIGRGDMLLSTGNDLVRIQCGFVDTPEVEAICEFIGSQQGYPEAFLLPEYTEEGGTSESGHLSDDERDVIFEDAARVIVMHQQGSTSLLQRKLKLGYNRAGRIIDQLEMAGIIGPFEGSKARKVLVPDEASLEQILQRDKP